MGEELTLDPRLAAIHAREYPRFSDAEMARRRTALARVMAEAEVGVDLTPLDAIGPYSALRLLAEIGPSSRKEGEALDVQKTVHVGQLALQVTHVAHVLGMGRDDGGEVELFHLPQHSVLVEQHCASPP